MAYRGKRPNHVKAYWSGARGVITLQTFAGKLFDLHARDVPADFRLDSVFKCEVHKLPIKPHAIPAKSEGDSNFR